MHHNLKTFISLLKDAVGSRNARVVMVDYQHYAVELTHNGQTSRVFIKDMEQCMDPKTGITEWHPL